MFKLALIGWTFLSLMAGVVYREIDPPVMYAAIPDETPRVRVVMVTASWCGWCQRWKQSEQPKLKEGGWSFGGSGQTLEYHDTGVKGNPYRVSGLPAFIFLKDEKEVGRLVGYHPAATIQSQFERHQNVE